MRVLIDTCVIIDALQSRAPFAEAAQKNFLYSANKHIAGFITAKTAIRFLKLLEAENDTE